MAVESSALIPVEPGPSAKPPEFLFVAVPEQEWPGAEVAVDVLANDTDGVVLVGTDGSVENRVVPVDSGTGSAALNDVANFINARLSGMTLGEAEAVLRKEIGQRKEALDRAAAELIASGLAAWSEDHARRPVLIVRGQANLIDEGAAGETQLVGPAGEFILTAKADRIDLATLTGRLCYPISDESYLVVYILISYVSGYTCDKNIIMMIYLIPITYCN